MPTIGAAVMAAERETSSGSSFSPLIKTKSNKKQKMTIGKFGKKKDSDGLQYSQVKRKSGFKKLLVDCKRTKLNIYHNCFQNAIKKAIQSANSTLSRLTKG